MVVVVGSVLPILSLVSGVVLEVAMVVVVVVVVVSVLF